MSKTSAAKKDEAQAPTPAKAEGQTTAVSLSKAQKAGITKLPTVSARIRYLDSEGFSRSQITNLIPNAKGDKLRYQHVRNVLITPVAKAKS